MTTHEHAHPMGYRQYFMTWVWLLIMTALALAIGYIHTDTMPEAVKAALLVGITLAKIFLIGSIFMHLKSERVNLVMLTFSPLLLAIVLFFFTFGETLGTNPTHKIDNVSPNFVMPTGQAEEH